MKDQDEMFAEIPSPTSGEDAASPLEKDAASPLEKEELQKRGAKIFACNERRRACIAEISHLANECLLNTNHPNGYGQVQYGKDYRTYGKAMSEILKLVEEQLGESEGQMAEVRGQSAKPEDQDKAAKHDKFHRRHWTFCNGLFPISFVVTQEGFMERCTINGRRFKASVIQEEQYNAMTWNGYIYDNGKCVCMVSGMGKGKRGVMDMTHAAFKAYVKHLSGPGGGKYPSHGGFLKINAKRALAAKQQAHDNKGSAATHS